MRKYGRAQEENSGKQTHKCVHELWGSLPYNAGIDLILFSTPSTLIKVKLPPRTQTGH